MTRKPETRKMTRKAFVFLFVCVLSLMGLLARVPRSSSTMRINEVLVENRFTNLDADENASPWVELINAGLRPVDTSGFSLTNDVTVPRKWRLPSQEVPPGGRLLVWLSGKDRAPRSETSKASRNLHASFELSARGETLMLVAPDGSTSDALFLLPQSEDRSYGRFPEGSGDFRYLLFPTPGEENREPSAARPFPSRLRLRPEGGRYDRRIEVEMSVPLTVDDIEIRYTTDASEPTTSSLLYAHPVVLSPSSAPDALFLRAAVFHAGRRITPIETHSYFLAGETYRLPLLSVSMEPHDFWTLQVESHGHRRDAEYPAFIEVIDAAGSRTVASRVGIRLHGHTARLGGFDTKKSYRLYFRELYGTKALRHPLIRDEGIALKRIVLRGNNDDAFRGHPRAAYIRDQLLRELHEEMGQPVVHGAWYSLLVNFEFIGVYNVSERIDQFFLSSHIDTHAVEWDIVHGNEVTEGSQREWERLRTLMGENDLTDDIRYAEALELIDVVNFTDYMILNIWAQNSDWPHKNYYLVRPRVPGGKWIFLSWDAESVLGLHQRILDLNTFHRALTRGGLLTETFSALMRNPRYQELFVERFERHMAGVLEPERVVEKPDLMADIGPSGPRSTTNRRRAFPPDHSTRQSTPNHQAAPCKTQRALESSLRPRVSSSNVESGKRNASRRGGLVLGGGRARVWSPAFLASLRAGRGAGVFEAVVGSSGVSGACSPGRSAPAGRSPLGSGSLASLRRGAQPSLSSVSPGLDDRRDSTSPLGRRQWCPVSGARPAYCGGNFRAW